MNDDTLEPYEVRASVVYTENSEYAVFEVVFLLDGDLLGYFVDDKEAAQSFCDKLNGAYLRGYAAARKESTR